MGKYVKLMLVMLIACTVTLAAKLPTINRPNDRHHVLSVNGDSHSGFVAITNSQNDKLLSHYRFVRSDARQAFIFQANDDEIVYNLRFEQPDDPKTLNIIYPLRANVTYKNKYIYSGYTRLSKAVYRSRLLI